MVEEPEGKNDTTSKTVALDKEDPRLLRFQFASL